MSERMPAMQSGGTAGPQPARHVPAPTRPPTAPGDQSIRSADGVSLAAALAGTLLSATGEAYPHEFAA